MLKFKKIRLILGDQLNPQHSWFQKTEKSVLYVFMEIRPESEYVKHHVQKLLGFFAGMRHFAGQLEQEGFNVCYFKINDSDNKHSFENNLMSTDLIKS